MSVVDAWTALADPTRRRVLALVAQAPSSVTALAEQLPVSRPAVSQHLQVLLEAGLVTVRPRGRHRIYAARPETLVELRRELDGFWAQALANFHDLAEAAADMTPITDRKERP